MDHVLRRLQAYIAEHPETAIFDPPATPAHIAATEQALKLPIPDQYKSFLLTFDGGFITTRGGKRDTWLSKEHQAWNSNQFMSCAGLTWATKALQDMYGTDPEGPWASLGFFQTADQEFLAFAPPTHPTPGAVLRVIPGEVPVDWAAIYPTFESFLVAYLDQQGHDNVIWPDFRPSKPSGR